MQRRPVTTSVEFLQTEAGRKFARSMIQEVIDQTKEEQPEVKLEDPIAEWDDLLKQFCEHLDHDLAPWDGKYDQAEMRKALADSYHDRFLDLYPKDPLDAAKYVLALTKIVRWLAWLTCEMWLLDTHPEFTSYPKKRPDTGVRTCHLLWARETFGWWRAHLDKFVKGRLGIDRPCSCVPDRTSEAIMNALDPQQRAQLEAIEAARNARDARDGDPVEVENGCPLC